MTEILFKSIYLHGHEKPSCQTNNIKLWSQMFVVCENYLYTFLFLHTKINAENRRLSCRFSGSENVQTVFSLIFNPVTFISLRHIWQKHMWVCRTFSFAFSTAKKCNTSNLNYDSGTDLKQGSSPQTMSAFS